MKKIWRMYLFSMFALIITSIWNKGFILPSDIKTILIASALLAITYYIIVPLSRVILLPLNILTFGLVTFLLYLFIIYTSSTGFNLFTIEPWQFPGFSLMFVTIPPTQLSYLANLVLSSISISGIINILEQLV